MKKKTKKRALRWLFFIAGLWLTTLIMAFVHQSDPVKNGIPMYKGPAHVTQAGQAPSAPAPTGLTTAVPMTGTSAPLFHHNVAPTPAATQTKRVQSTNCTGSIVRTSSSHATQIMTSGNGSGATGASNHASRPLESSVNISTSMSNALAYSAIPLAARSVQGGITADEGIQMRMARRAIIDGDPDYDPESGEDPLNPGYNPTDPFLTPIGDANWLLILLSAMYAVYGLLRRRKRNGTYLH